MSRRVLKFKFLQEDYNDGFVKRMGVYRGSRILRVDSQFPDDPLPTIWVEVEDEAKKEDLFLSLVPTGDVPPIDSSWVGTAICASGELVWHLYQVEQKKEGNSGR